MLSIEKQMLYLLSRTEQMDSHELIRIYEKRNYSAAYIRNGLSRLKKEQYAVSPSRSIYQITELGRSFIQSVNLKPQLYDEVWDRTWYLAMIEIPEAERKKRDQFRSDIIQAGFGSLYNSVYISPWDYRKEVEQIVQKHALEERITVIHGTIEKKPITPDQARAIWQLDAVKEKYMEKQVWFNEQFEPEMQQALQSGADALDIFILYLHLGEVISELYLTDPMLPEELLPDDWAGKTILKQLKRHNDALADAIPPDSPYARFVKAI